MRKQAGKRGVSSDPIPPAVPTRQRRDPKTHRFLPIDPNDVGTVGAHTTHALRSPRVPPEFIEQEERFLGAALSDEGGEQDLPARRRSQVQYRAVVHRQILMLDAALRVHGMFDKRRKLRERWLDKLVSLVNTATRIDIALGFERRARALVPSPREWVKGAGEGEEAGTCERG